MRIFVLGAGATGSLLAQLLRKQGHDVTCGDRDAERARRFLGKKSAIPVVEVNARNLWGIVRAARRCQLLVNASPAVFNEIVLRAALRLRCHYLDMSAHMTRHPFKAEQLGYAKRFEQKHPGVRVDVGSLTGAEDTIDAMDLRAFGVGKRTWYRKLEMDTASWLVVGAFLLFLFVATSLNLSGQSEHYLLPFLVP